MQSCRFQLLGTEAGTLAKHVAGRQCRPVTVSTVAASASSLLSTVDHSTSRRE